MTERPDVKCRVCERGHMRLSWSEPRGDGPQGGFAECSFCRGAQTSAYDCVDVPCLNTVWRQGSGGFPIPDTAATGTILAEEAARRWIAKFGRTDGPK